MKTRRPPILLEAMLTLACAGLALAQTSAGSIRGAVTDPTGSVLPNASVTVKNLDTNSERKLTTNYTGWNGVVNLDDLQESYGIHPNDRPHRLNFSGIYELPEYKGEQRLLRGLLNGWQLSTINQFQSSPPVNPTIAIDVDGEGTSIHTLPGIEWNGFGRNVSADDLRKTVEAYNADVLARSNLLPANATAAQRAVCTLVVNGQTFCAPRTPH